MNFSQRLALVCLLVTHCSVWWLTFVDGKCIRRPLDTEADRTVGSNGFHLKILSNPRNDSVPAPEGYIPGEEYLVVLEGWKAQYTVQTFRGFSIVAVKAGSDDLSQPVGKFKVIDHPSAKQSSSCWHGVTHTSRHPKTEVEVVWQAPPTNVGCLEFRAMVLEYQDIWYMDEGPLTKKFCQLIGHEPVKTQASTSECCACDEAKYELTFEGIWSRQTHPKDYPTMEQLLHFSDVIGASHSAKYSEWAYGAYASDGLKELAEWGNTFKMEQEMKKKAKEIRTIIKARGLWYPQVQGTTKAVFRVDKYHHLLSLASMIGPSPDWLVGISAENLCTADCQWTEERYFDLYPWDAGTDSGTTYMSPNRPTLPREQVRKITTKDPPNSPFYDISSDSMTPLAKLIVKRQKVYHMECHNASHYANMDSNLEAAGETETSEDLEFSSKPGCEVGSWTGWSDCSATCGKGIAMRTRVYLNPVKAQLMGCKRHMVGKKFCNAAISECQDSAAFNDMCTVSEWSAWTECSVTCAKGIRSRTRQYENAMAMKKCSLELMEKEMCIGGEGMDCSITPDPLCRTTVWSDWSPCSVTCGPDGMKVRTRLMFYPENQEQCFETSLMEKQRCSAEFADCQSVIFQHRAEICTEPQEAGQCSGVFPRYFYDAGENSCKRFIYTGCKGNRNNFQSIDECSQICIAGQYAFPPSVMPNKAVGQPLNKTSPNMPAKVMPATAEEQATTQRSRGEKQQEIEDEQDEDTSSSNWNIPVIDLSIDSDFITVHTTTAATTTSTKPTKPPRFRHTNIKHIPPTYANTAGLELSHLPSDQKSSNSNSSLISGKDAKLLAKVSKALNIHSIEPYYNLATGMICVRVSQLALALGVNDGEATSDAQSLPVVDCMVTDWGPWSECSKTCGSKARKQRLRMIKVYPQNGGQSCPANLIETVKCNLRPCHLVADHWASTVASSSSLESFTSALDGEISTVGPDALSSPSPVASEDSVEQREEQSLGIVDNNATRGNPSAVSPTKAATASCLSYLLILLTVLLTVVA